MSAPAEDKENRVVRWVQTGHGTYERAGPITGRSRPTGRAPLAVLWNPGYSSATPVTSNLDESEGQLVPSVEDIDDSTLLSSARFWILF